MARPIKEGIEAKYQYWAKKIAENKSPRAYYKYMRGAASNFTKRKDVRELVFERDNYTCQICGSKDDLTVDHIIPIIYRGENHTDNFQTLCRSCNSGKLL